MAFLAEAVEEIENDKIADIIVENKCLVITAQKLMSVVINVSKTYRKPIQTYSRLFELGASEKQNLAFLIGGCVISFVSQWPVRALAFANQSIDELMGAILLSNLFLPLIFYFISMVMYIFAKV